MEEGRQEAWESFAEWELIIKHFCASFLATFAWLINKHFWLLLVLLLPQGALLTRLGES